MAIQLSRLELLQIMKLYSRSKGDAQRLRALARHYEHYGHLDILDRCTRSMEIEDGIWVALRSEGGARWHVFILKSCVHD